MPLGKAIFACGIPIPNANLEYKSDGLGLSAGNPDGYRSSSQYDIDRAFARITTYWGALRRGDVNFPGYAPVFASRGRAYTIGAATTATSNTARYIETPPSLPGYTWMTESNDPLLTTNDFWWVRLRMWWRGSGSAPGAAAAWVAQVWGYANAAESSPTLLCSITLNGVSDWGTGWVQKASTPFKVTTTLHHIRVRFIPERGPAIGVSYGSFTDFSVETLGPVDAAATVSSNELLNPTYAEEGAGGTYYQLSKTWNYTGYKKEPIRFGKTTRLPSGGWRRSDPSGGAMRSRFTIPVTLMTRKDYEKLYRIWLANRGYSQDLGSYYGTPMPTIFSPQSADDQGFYYVAWEDDEFPLVPDNTWMPATADSMLYKGVISLVEI